MKTRFKPSLLILLVLVLISFTPFLAPESASAVPQPVMILSGQVTILGFEASDGIPITAEINGVAYKTATSVNITLDGSYGVQAAFPGACR